MPETNLWTRALPCGGVWRPLPDPAGDPAPPTALGGTLDTLLAHLGAPPVDVVRALDEHWATIVGEAQAAHVRLAGLDHGTLVVEVDAPGWATRMRFAARQVLAAAEPFAGPGVVTALEVQVRPQRRSRGGR